MYRLTFIHLLLSAYVYIRAVHPLRVRWWWKALLGALLILPALRNLLLAQAGGLIFAPTVPPWLLCCTAALYVAFLICFLGVFGGYILRLLVLSRLLRRKQIPTETQQSVFNRLHLALLPLALGLSIWGVYEGRALPRLQQISIPFPTPQPLRIALISDLHISSTRSPEHLREIVRMVNAQQPDLVAITGDFVDGKPEDCMAQLEPLRELKAPLGVFGVTGNHDYYSGYAGWRPFFEAWGIRMLDNSHVLLPRPFGILLAGVTDESAAFEGLEGPDLPKALHDAPADAPILLLAHRPIVAREAAPLGVRLQLSGHLHGGLVWGLGIVVAAMDAGYRAGLYRVGDMDLYVSPGAGSSSRTPLRLGVPTEVTLITLTPEHS